MTYYLHGDCFNPRGWVLEGVNLTHLPCLTANTFIVGFVTSQSLTALKLLGYWYEQPRSGPMCGYDSSVR